MPRSVSSSGARAVLAVAKWSSPQSLERLMARLSAPEQPTEHAADQLRPKAGRSPPAPAQHFAPDLVGDLPPQRRSGGAPGRGRHLVPGRRHLRALGGDPRALGLLGRAGALLLARGIGP